MLCGQTAKFSVLNLVVCKSSTGFWRVNSKEQSPS